MWPNWRTTQIAALTTTQVRALTATNLAVLADTQIAAFTATQIAAFSTTNFSSLADTQIGALTTTQIGALTAAQLQSLSTPTSPCSPRPRWRALNATPSGGDDDDADQRPRSTPAIWRKFSRRRSPALTTTQVRRAHRHAMSPISATPSRAR